jgi:hypothetical protein
MRDMKDDMKGVSQVVLVCELFMSLYMVGELKVGLISQVLIISLPGWMTNCDYLVKASLSTSNGTRENVNGRAKIAMVLVSHPSLETFPKKVTNYVFVGRTLALNR